jgi:arylsulfatase A-like enzyme
VDGFSVDFETRRVAEYLHQQHGDLPFFLYYNISPPHMPLADAPEKYLAMYSPGEVPLRPNVYQDSELACDERWFRIYLWDFLYYQEHLPYTEQLPEGFDLRHLTALYYGMVTWVDDTVGRLVAALESAGLAENTIIVFLSDHGDNLGSHQRFNKDTLMEESIRIPLIFHAPGLWKPHTNQAQVAQIIDVMPTLLETCGSESLAGMQGHSLVPILTGAAETVGDGVAFIETSGGQIGIRTPTHLYGVQLAPDLRAVVNDRLCFFDLRSDPYEQDNLAATDVQSALTSELRRRLVEWNRHTPWLANEELKPA